MDCLISKIQDLLQFSSAGDIYSGEYEDYCLELAGNTLNMIIYKAYFFFLNERIFN